MKLKRVGRLRILDWDIENRPLSYLGSDFTTSDITAIAASFVGESKVRVWLLGVDTTEEMLRGFVELYDEADIVTGHYIRKHDLPIVNGALIECGLPSLGQKLVSDTKTDLVRRQGVSASQESLADMLHLAEGKYHMTQARWRRANRLTLEGIEETRKRVTMDVRQHKKLRAALAEHGYLGAPKVWSP